MKDILLKPGYLETYYNDKDKPYTEYPDKLAKYLSDAFGIKEGDKLLDIGCGRGDFSKGFNKLGVDIYCVDKDIDSGCVDVEKDRLPYKEETFDFVFSKSVLEHIFNPDNFMKESLRVLKPGGKIIIMTPDWQSQRLVFYNDHTHIHPYTEEGLGSLIKSYGFENVESELFYQLPILWRYPRLKMFSRMLQLLGPVKKIYKNKFLRWSRELMILGSGIKE